MPDETRNTVEDSLPGATPGPTSQSPAEKKSGDKDKDGSTSGTEATTTYTAERVQELISKAVSDALAKAGRDAKSLESLRKSLETQEAELSAIQADPAKGGILQQRKKFKEQEAALSAREEALAQREAELEEDRKLARSSRRQNLIAEVAQDYQDIDVARLTDLCDKLNLTEREQIVTAAESLGSHKGPAAARPPVTPDSGVTNGGAENLDNKSPRELAILGYSKKKK